MIGILFGVLIGMLPLAAHAQSADSLSQLLNITLPAHDASNPPATQAATGTVYILYEAGSYVPPFYQGRSLPSPGSAIRVQALTHFKLPDGTPVSDKDVTFTWFKDRTVLGQLSGVGKSTAIIQTSLIQGLRTISVDAAAPGGIVTGHADLPITFINPFITLYEDHPLYGVLYNNALFDSSSISEREATFAATPYYAVAPSPNDPRFVYEWSVNGSPISASPRDPSEITIGANAQTPLAAGQNASISVRLTRTDDALFETFDTWHITLGQLGQGSGASRSAAGSSSLFQ